MKTIRLLYPDYLSGGLETYYFGAHLLAHILPQNENQPLYKVELAPPDGRERPVTDGVCARDEVTAVSYTHLDVYKRQGQGSAPDTSFRIRWAPASECCSSANRCRRSFWPM